jgi:hypothetical protein
MIPSERPASLVAPCERDSCRAGRPSFAQVFSGKNRDVWIEGYLTPNATASVWTLLDANWRIAGRVCIPQQNANGRM